MLFVFALILPRFLSFTLDLASHPLVFFPSSSLSLAPVPLRFARCQYPCRPRSLARSLAPSFVSHSEEDVNCLALGPNQYQWPPKRRQRKRERRTRTRTISTTATTTSRARGRRDASSYGTGAGDDDGGGGGNVGSNGRRKTAAVIAARLDQSCLPRSALGVAPGSQTEGTSKRPRPSVTPLPCRSSFPCSSAAPVIVSLVHVLAHSLAEPS